MRRPPEARSASTHWTTPITGAISSRWEPCSPDEKTGAGQWPEPVSPRPSRTARESGHGPAACSGNQDLPERAGCFGARICASFSRCSGVSTARICAPVCVRSKAICACAWQRVGSLPGLGLVEGVGTAQFAQRFVRGTQRLSLVIEGLRLVVTDLEDLVLLFLAEIQGAQAMAAEMTVMAGVAAGVVPAHVMLAGTAIGRHAGRGRGGQGCGDQGGSHGQGRE